MKDNKLWQEVLSVLQNTLKENEINIWLKPLKIEDLRGDLITLSAPNKFIKNWVEEKYINILHTKHLNSQAKQLARQQKNKYF